MRYETIGVTSRLHDAMRYSTLVGVMDACLRAAADSGRLLNEAAVKVLGPASALIARRADHFRAHLLIETASRSTLQRFLKNWLPHVEQLLKAAGLRWSIDVDPLEVD